MELLSGSHSKLNTPKDVDLAKETSIKMEPPMMALKPMGDKEDIGEADVRLQSSNGPLSGYPPGPGKTVNN